MRTLTNILPIVGYDFLPSSAKFIDSSFEEVLIFRGNRFIDPFLHFFSISKAYICQAPIFPAFESFPLHVNVCQWLFGRHSTPKSDLIRLPNQNHHFGNVQTIVHKFFELEHAHHKLQPANFQQITFSSGFLQMKECN